MTKKGYFKDLPISFFGAFMGLAGLGISWRFASEIYGLPFIVSRIIVFVAVIASVALFVCYLIKIITNNKAFKDEYESPVTRSLFGTFIISLLLLPVVLEPYFPVFASVLWILGVILMFFFGLRIMSFWLGEHPVQTHVSPAWIIPVVGTLEIPMAFRLFDFGWGYDVSVAALAAGLFFTIPVFTLIMSRILFFEPVESRATPSLMIMIAPFVVGFSAYTEITGKVDLFAQGLYFVGLFIFLTLLPQIVKSRLAQPFRVSWWAVSFPLSSLLTATLRMTMELDKYFLHVLSFFLLFIVSLVVVILMIRTIKDLFEGKLPENS